MSADTTTTTNLWRLLRSHLLAYTPAAGDTLSTRLGDRLWYVQAPDDAAFPYGVGRLTWRSGPDAAVERREVELELQLFARPRSEAETLEDCADLCDAAFYRYVDTTSGVAKAEGDTRRDTLPPFGPPADREVVQIRLVYPFTVWPASLLSLATLSGAAS